MAMVATWDRLALLARHAAISCQHATDLNPLTNLYTSLSVRRVRNQRLNHGDRDLRPNILFLGNNPKFYLNKNNRRQETTHYQVNRNTVRKIEI